MTKTAEKDICEKNETCPICPHNTDCDSIVYTPEQIDAFCQPIEAAIARRYDVDRTVRDAVKIIRQLQEPRHDWGGGTTGR